MTQPLFHHVEMDDVKPVEAPRSPRVARPLSPTVVVQVSAPVGSSSGGTGGGADPLASMIGDSPHETYGWWHWAFYTWVGNLLTHGWDRDAALQPMNMTDLLRMPAFEDPRVNQRRLQAEWQLELQRSAEARAKNPVPAGATAEEAEAWHAPSLGNALWRAFRTRVIIGGIFRLISDGCTVGSAFVLREFVTWMATPSFMTTEGKGWMWLAIIVIIQLVMSLTLNASMHHTFIGFEQMRSACVLEVFDAALRFSADHTDTGKILSAHATDTQNFVEIAQFVHGLWVSPLLVVAAVISLVVFIGWSGLICFAIMLVTMPLQGVVMRYVFLARSGMLEEGDKRVAKINECLQGIRICKFMGWEENFAQRIATARAAEVEYFGSMQRWRVVLMVVMQAMPMVLNFLMFALVYAMDKEKMSVANVFPAYTMLNTLRMPLTLVPLAYAKLFDVQLACERIQRIMMDKGRVQYVQQHPDSEAKAAAMTMEDVTVVGRGGQVVAANLSLSVPKGALTVVVGATASGKSTLIKALIGEAEIERTHGAVHHYGTAALVPQEAWIMNATVRKNITMDLPFDQAKYDRTVLACQLTSDFDQLTAGDATEIGERGINVSGGQKQRIAFARAVYSGRDTVLMDDPLSAVDSHVSAALFDGCIRGALDGRTRVLVTHQVQLLPHADYAVLMEDCKIKFAGTIDELRATGYELPSLEDAHKAEQPTATAKPTTTTTTVAAPSPAQKQEAAGGKLMSDEDTAIGGIAWATYGWYVALGGVPMYVGLLFMGLFTQTGFTISNIIMARWSARQPVLNSLGDWSQLQYIEWMGIFTLIGIFFLALRVLMFAQFSINCAEKSHDALARNVLRAPTSFFDTTPMGRIINRFTKDMASIDTLVSNHMELAINLFFTICGTIFTVCYSSVWLILIFPPVIICFCLVYMYYSKTVRGLKRLENTNRSPMLAIMNEVCGGLASIRVYRIQGMLMETHASRTVTALLPSYNLRAAQRWLSSRTELLAAVIVFFCCLFGVLSRTRLESSLNISPALMSLAVSNAIAVTNVFTYLVRSLADMETEMSSTERVKQYSEAIPQEAALAYAGEEGALPGAPAAPPKAWPATARVDLDEYSLRYRPGLPLVLRDLTFAIENKQKIGVVGRTGSGKSTLLLAIFRIVEAAGGRISIDGRDIATLKLADLRKAITIIPQDPMLFSGTVRSNLDPFGEHSDAAVWAVLDRLQLRPRLTTFITEGPSGLNAPVEEKGGNFSVGQRQLLCMARALLKRAPILMLDEATASVDFETDAMIQRLIREEFKDCTVITIAHRLATIIDSDKVLVLAHGELVEYDAPATLLRAEGGALRGMVERLGAEQFNMLLAVADGQADASNLLQVDTTYEDK